MEKYINPHINISTVKSKKRLEEKIKKFTANKNYDGLFAVTQKIISKRKNSLKEKIDNYKEKCRHYIRNKKIVSEEEFNEILFLAEQLNTLKRVYDLCDKISNGLRKNNIYELAAEAESQYNEYLKEIWYLKFCEQTGCPF